MELFLRTLIKLSLLGSALAVVLTILRPLLRRWANRKTAYYLWLLVLLRLCVPVGIELPVPVAAEEPAPAEVQTVPDLQEDLPAAQPEPEDPAGIPEPTPSQGTAAIIPTQSTITPTKPVIPPIQSTAPSSPNSFANRLKEPAFWAILWAIGAIAGISWFMLGYLHVSGAIRRTAWAASPEALAILRELDPKGRVRLVESPVVNTPLLLGALHPVIVLPFGVTDPARLRDILAHELTHVHRHDLLFKWFAAVVTSLHWFNPLMLLVRREISRACELSCDEAVVRRLDSQGRRHYGETLLLLAAHAPRGLGSMAVTLCEEKKQLKERLACIVKYKKSGPLVLFLSLVLAAVMGACAMVTGVTAVTPGAPEFTPGEGPHEQDTLPPAIIELDNGLAIAFPDDIVDQLIIKYREPNWQGDDRFLFAVYEKKSYEDTLADWDYEGGGYLFGIDRYTQAQYEQYLTEDGSGISSFATDGTYYYMHTYATDVQFYRSEIESYSNDIMEPWYELEAHVGGVLNDFISRNGLEPFTGSGQDFTYDSAHKYVLYRNGTWDMNMNLTLSQPAAQGEGGIWCVERWQDSYGNVQLTFPGEGVTPAAEYYRDLQTRVDSGEYPELLDPVQAALVWLKDHYSYTDALTLSIDGLTLVEGEPAGDVWARIWDILTQEGTLTLGIYDDQGNPGSHVETFSAPTYDSYPGFGGSASTELRPRSWLKAEPVDSYWWRAVGYTTETGDGVFFLKNDGLVCIRTDGTEEWFRDAFWQSRTPYEVMYGICEYCARYADDGISLRFSDEEVEAAIEAVQQLFEEDSWKTTATLEECGWDAAESQWLTTTFLENGSGPVYNATRENTIVINGTYTTGNRQAVQGTAWEADSTYEWHFWLIRENKDSPWEIVDMGV